MKLFCAYTTESWENSAQCRCQLECCSGQGCIWPSAAVKESLCPFKVPPLVWGEDNHINSTQLICTLFTIFQVKSFFPTLKRHTNIRCLFFRVTNLENQPGIPQDVSKASKNLTCCGIFSSQFLGSLLPCVCKAQHRTSNCSTPTTEAAAVRVPFTGTGYLFSEPSALTCQEQGVTSNLA